MVVTKAPSEPFSVVRRTLIGALSQGGILHDTWLADEDPDEETSAWCSANGVRISSRKGLADYHRPDWPRRTKSKEGNLTFFYDRYGYDNYDFVSQFDADHVPEPDYLRHAIAPFADPSVGYVSAPSICDSNAADSWAARARLYVEASLHGALQCGYNNGWAPLCIGSHYSVRTTALRQVGGLGPELAEDHSTTLILNAGGWNGVHAVDAIAHGAGPDTFADLVTQEFQWSRSLVAILLRYSPTYVPRLAGRKRFQFIFSQLWYPVFSGMMAIMYVMPIYALLSGNHLVNVTYVAYLVHILPLSATLIALAYWWRSTGLFRPRDARIVSPEGMAFIMLRWPWSLLGSIAAALDRLRGKVAPFKITHKGPRASARLPLRATQPYLLLSLIASIVAFAVDDPGTAGGFYLFNLVNAAVYGGLSVFVLIRHAHENGIAFFNFHLAGLVVGVSLSAVVALSLAAAYRNGPKGLYSMMVGIEAFHLTRTIYPIAGAGQGDPGKPIIRFSPGWGPR
jgi:cellulose synthase (UDP-forming)